MVMKVFFLLYKFASFETSVFSFNYEYTNNQKVVEGQDIHMIMLFLSFDEVISRNINFIL